MHTGRVYTVYACPCVQRLGVLAVVVPGASICTTGQQNLHQLHVGEFGLWWQKTSTRKASGEWQSRCKRCVQGSAPCHAHVSHVHAYNNTSGGVVKMCPHAQAQHGKSRYRLVEGRGQLDAGGRTNCAPTSDATTAWVSHMRAKTSGEAT